MDIHIDVRVFLKSMYGFSDQGTQIRLGYVPLLCPFVAPLGLATEG